MTVEELTSACKNKVYLQLASNTRKRPLPNIRAELLCFSSSGGSVWLYKTKAILGLLKRTEVDINRYTYSQPKP